MWSFATRQIPYVWIDMYELCLWIYFWNMTSVISDTKIFIMQSDMSITSKLIELLFLMYLLHVGLHKWAKLIVAYFEISKIKTHRWLNWFSQAAASWGSYHWLAMKGSSCFYFKRYTHKFKCNRRKAEAKRISWMPFIYYMHAVHIWSLVNYSTLHIWYIC